MKHYGLDIPEGSDITNLTAPSGGAFPGNANVGEMFYRTDQDLLYVYTGSWIDITGAGGGSSLWTDSSPDIYFNTGDVGIGTASPVARLDIAGPTALQLRLTDSETNTTTKSSYITQRHYTNAEEDVALIYGVAGAGANTINIGGAHASLNSATDIKFFTAATNTTVTGTERMIIASDGQVGIGNSSPDATLHVETGSSGATPVAGYDIIAESNSNGGIQILVPDANNANLLFGSASDNVGAFITWNHDADLLDIATSKVGADIAFSAGNNTEVMVVSSEGNVGVGITPTRTGNAGMQFHHTNYPELHFTNTTSGSAAANGMLIGLESDADGYIWNYGVAKDIYLAPGNSEKVRFYSTGGMAMAGATGGDQGAGTINATELYVNGVAVGGGSVWSESGSDIYYDSGIVAIGTSTFEPWNSTFTALQIGGSASLFGSTTPGGGNAWGSAQNAYFDGAWKYILADEASMYQQSNGDHIFYTAGVGTVDGTISWSLDMVIRDSGDVAIGTNTPSSRLDVVATTGVGLEVTNDTTASLAIFDSTAAADSVIEFKNNGTQIGFWKTRTGDIVIGTTGLKDITFQTNDANVARIHDSGNMSIGTMTDSGSRLHVKSSGTATDPIYVENSTGNVIAKIRESGSGDGLIQGFDSTGTLKVYLRADGGDSYVPGNFAAGATSLQTYTGLTGVQVGGGISSVVATAAAPAAGQNIQTLQNAYYDGAWKYGVTDEASRQLQLNGTHQFDVAASGTADTAISWTTAMVIDNSGDVTLNGHLLLPQDNDAVTPTLAFGDGDTGFYEGVDDLIGISNAGVFTWSISATQLAGATTSAASLRNIASTSTDPVFTFNGDNNTGMGRAAADELSLITGGVESVRIDASQNVGINNTSPAQKLDVVGNIVIDNASGYQVGGSVDTAIGELKNTAGALALLADGSRDIQLGSDTVAQAIFIEGTNGNVGIGTSSPGALLHISGAQASTSLGAGHPGLFITNTDTTVNNRAAITFNDGTGSNAAAIQCVFEDHTSDYGSLSFVTRASGGLFERMYIDTDGNVGIGTTGPSRKLHVLSTTADVARFEGSSTHIDIDGGGNQITGSSNLAFRGTGSGAADMVLNADGGLYMEGATGTSQGSGTINATELYINGTALSDTFVNVSGDTMTGELTMGEGDAVNWNGTNVRIYGSNASDKFAIRTTNADRFTITGTAAEFISTDLQLTTADLTLTNGIADFTRSSTGVALQVNQQSTGDIVRFQDNGANMFAVEDGGDINAYNNTIKNVADPTNNQDAATKIYVDNIVTSGTVWEDPIVDPDLVDISSTADPAADANTTWIAYGGSYPQTWGTISDVAQNDVLTRNDADDDWIRIDTLSAGDRFILAGDHGTFGTSNDFYTAGFRTQELIEYVSGNPTLAASWTVPHDGKYQVIDFTSTKSGSDSTGFANDATVYVLDVTVDTTLYQVQVTGSTAQTFTNLITQINADLTGATATLEAEGHVHIAADNGTDRILISEGTAVGTGMLATLTDFEEIHGGVVNGTTVIVNDPDSLHFGDTFHYAFEGNNFTLIAGPGAIVAGTGLSYSGNTLNVDDDYVKIAGDTMDGALHIEVASAGAVTAHANADDLIVENSANAGISLLTPDASNSYLYFGTPTDSVGALVEWDYTSNLMTIGTSRSGADLRLRTSDGAEAVRIDSAGNVGIGRNDPQRYLHVDSGTADVARFEGNTTHIDIDGGGNQISGSSELKLRGSGAGAADVVIEADGGVYLDGATGGGQGVGTLNAQALYVNGVAVGGGSQWTDSGSDIYYGSGSIGIIDTSPATRLGTYDGISIRNASAGPTYNELAVKFSNDSGGNTGFLVGMNDSRQGLVWHEQGLEIVFGTAATERMRIDSSGNVGIGITNPDGKLHVHSGSAGAVSASTNADEIVVEGSGNAGISILTPDANTSQLILGSLSDSTGGVLSWVHNTNLMTIGTANAGGILRFLNENSVEVMRIGANNLAVGSTTTSNGKLFVSGTAGDITVGGTGLGSAVLYLAQDGSHTGEIFNAANKTLIANDGQIQAETKTTNTAPRYGFGGAYTDWGYWLSTSGSPDSLRMTTNGSDRFIIYDNLRNTSNQPLWISEGNNQTMFDIYASNGAYTSNLVDIRVNRAAGTSYNLITASSSTDIEFKVRADGQIFSDAGTSISTPADYAEMFEWEDGNVADEDRVGYSVVLVGNQVRKAIGTDDPTTIIGIVSGNPAIVADSHWNNWNEKYLKDDFNRLLWEAYTTTTWVEKVDGVDTTMAYDSDRIPAEVTVPGDAVVVTEDDNGNTLMRKVLNPSYDPNLAYVPREDRKEWDAIGLMGKLRLIKGEPVNPNWIKMRDISATVEEWLVR